MATSQKKEKGKTAMVLDMGSKKPQEVAVVDGDSPFKESANGAAGDDKAEEAVVVPATDSAPVEVVEVKKDSSPVGLDLKAKRELDAPRRRYIYTRALSNELRRRKMTYDLSEAEMTALSDRLGGRQFEADEVIGRIVWDDGGPLTCVSSRVEFQPHASLLLDHYAVSKEGFAKVSSRLSAVNGELTAKDLELLSVKRTGRLDGQLVELGAYCARYNPEKKRWVGLGPLSGTQFFTDPNTGRTFSNRRGCLGEVRYDLGVEALKRDFPNLLASVEENLARELGEDVVSGMGEAFAKRVSAKFVQEVKEVRDEYVQLAHTFSRAQVVAFVKAMNAEILEKEERWKAEREEKKAAAAAPRSSAERKFREEEERIRKRGLVEMEIEID